MEVPLSAIEEYFGIKLDSLINQIVNEDDQPIQ